MEFPGISKSEHMEFGPSGAAQDAMVRAATTQKSCWKCLKVHESWQTPMVIVYYIKILIYIYVPKVDNITNGYLFNLMDWCLGTFTGHLLFFHGISMTNTFWLIVS